MRIVRGDEDEKDDRVDDDDDDEFEMLEMNLKRKQMSKEERRLKD